MIELLKRGDLVCRCDSWKQPSFYQMGIVVKADDKDRYKVFWFGSRGIGSLYYSRSALVLINKKETEKKK